MNHASLLEAVSYDPLTGVFIRRVSAGNAKKGTVFGNLDAKGYLKGRVCGKYVRLNRLAWFYSYGDWPTNQIDHIDGDRTNNRLKNLRECDTSSNCLNQRKPRVNNALGVQGVNRIQKTGRYRARATIKGKSHHLGVFPTVEEASKAYQEFKKPYLPEIK